MSYEEEDTCHMSVVPARCVTRLGRIFNNIIVR
jgi:hypothetical protein